MPYTIQDWFREYGQVLVRVPAAPGSGKTWSEYWLPFSVFDEGARSPDWFGNRTSQGDEWRDFVANMAAYEGQ